jgi:hypothetical protein
VGRRQIVGAAPAMDDGSQQAHTIFIVCPVMPGFLLYKPNAFGKPTVCEFSGAEMGRKMKGSFSRRPRGVAVHPVDTPDVFFCRRSICYAAPFLTWRHREAVVGRDLIVEEVVAEAGGVERIAHTGCRRFRAFPYPYAIAPDTMLQCGTALTTVSSVGPPIDIRVIHRAVERLQDGREPHAFTLRGNRSGSRSCENMHDAAVRYCASRGCAAGVFSRELNRRGRKCVVYLWWYNPPEITIGGDQSSASYFSRQLHCIFCHRSLRTIKPISAGYSC